MEMCLHLLPLSCWNITGPLTFEVLNILRFEVTLLSVNSDMMVIMSGIGEIFFNFIVHPLTAALTKANS